MDVPRYVERQVMRKVRFVNKYQTGEIVPLCSLREVVENLREHGIGVDTSFQWRVYKSKNKWFPQRPIYVCEDVSIWHV